MEHNELQKYAHEASETLKRIKAVSCGEQQIKADGDYNDTDGLQWIFNEIKKFNLVWNKL